MAPPIDRDENVNGRRGVLPHSLRKNAESSPSPSVNVIPKPLSMFSENTLGMAAFRDKPVPKPQSSANIQLGGQPFQRIPDWMTQKPISNTKMNSEESLAIYILDISKVLHEDCIASWIPWKSNNQVGPDERIMYSLVFGKNELIVFGGIHNEKVTTHGHTVYDESEVYNDLHFISPPKYNI